VFSGPDVVFIPELSQPVLTPGGGLPGTEFTFEVDYFHHDGKPPWYIRVYIKDSPRRMTLKSGVASDGTYSCAVTLRTVGHYKHYFVCADSEGVLVRLPETGWFSGPNVKDPGDRNPFPKVAVHVMAHNPRRTCSRDFPDLTYVCSDIEVTYPGQSFDVFPVFFELYEYQGVEFGLNWPDWTYSAVWHSCADMAEGDIRRPGDGVSMVWFECQQDAVLIPGWAWIYADGPGQISVCPYPFLGWPYEIRILDCYGGTDEAFVTGYAGVYGAEGCHPCPP
jgi:hypothetical protein